MTRVQGFRRPLATLVTALVLAFGLTVIGTHARAASPSTDDAAAFIRDMGHDAIVKLGDTEVPYEDRVQTFREMVDTGFAMESISRFVLGRYWRVASADEKNAFQDVFLRVVAQRFLPLFEGYTLDDFEVTGARPDPNNPEKLFLVSSRVTQPSGDGKAKAGWRVQPRDEGFKIVDVLAEGVSMAITLRSEYNSLIQRNGGQVSALIERLEKNVEKGAYKPETAEDLVK